MPALLASSQEQASDWIELSLGESIPVHLASPSSRQDYQRALRGLRGPGSSRRTVLLALSACADATELEGLLDQASSKAARVVLTWAGSHAAPEASARWQPGGRWPAQVLLEHDPFKAVVGAMLALNVGDSLAVLWPRGDETPIRYWIHQGERWREHWEAPEEGEFHPLPFVRMDS